MNHFFRRVENTVRYTINCDRRANAAYAPVHHAGRLLHQQKRRADVPCHGPAGTPTRSRSRVGAVCERHTWSALGRAREFAAIHQYTGGPRLMGYDAALIGGEVQDNQRASRLWLSNYGPGAFAEGLSSDLPAPKAYTR